MTTPVLMINLTTKERQQMKNKLINFIQSHYDDIYDNIESYKSVVAHFKNGNLLNVEQKEYEREQRMLEIGRDHDSPLTNFQKLHKLHYDKIQATENYNRIQAAFESYNMFLETSHEEIKDQIGGTPFRFLTKDHHDIVDGVLNVVGLSGLSCFGLLIASTTIVIPSIGIVVVGIGCFALATWAIVGAMHALTKPNDEIAEAQIVLLQQKLLSTQINRPQDELLNQKLQIQKMQSDRAMDNMEKDKAAIEQGKVDLQLLKEKYKWQELQGEKKGGGICITYKDILDISKTLFVNIRLSKDAKDFIIQFVNNNVKPRPKKQTKQQTTILNQNSKRFMHIDIQHLQILVVKLINKGMKKIQKQDSKTLRAVHFL